MIRDREQSYASNSRAKWQVPGVFLLAIQVLGLLFVTPLLPAQTFTLLHTFTKGDGGLPQARLIKDAHGNLYGTTSQGGAFDVGTVFEINRRGKETILHSFWGGDGISPPAGVIRTQTGTYGTTMNGGKREGGGCVHGCGAVFQLDATHKLTVLHALTGGTDGGQPQGGLVQDDQGYLYGTTTKGGDVNCDYGWGCGAVFKINKKGKETVLYAFKDQPDGRWPIGDLIRDSAGNLYGVTALGGTGGGDGTIFKVDSSGQETVLYSFPDEAGGVYPQGPLVRDAEGNFFGVTAGNYQCGTVFKLNKVGKQTVLYSFAGTTDGCYPAGGLARDGRGNLYGVTASGGSGGGGRSIGWTQKAI
jgi:uncharacterized repeat protein (TIGR03803 family)